MKSNLLTLLFLKKLSSMCLNKCPNFGHITDIFWALPCDLDMLDLACCKCPNEHPEVKTHFGHYQQGWTCFGHHLDTFWVLDKFLDTLWTLLGTLRPKCVRPYIVLQCPLWVGQTQRVPEPFGLWPGHFLELNKLAYLIWKRRVWAICWSKNFEFFQTKSYYLSIFLSGPGLLQVTSTFCSTTHLFPRGKKATIPHFNQHIQGFHMIPIAWIFLGK